MINTDRLADAALRRGAKIDEQLVREIQQTVVQKLEQGLVARQLDNLRRWDEATTDPWTLTAIAQSVKVTRTWTLDGPENEQSADDEILLIL